MKISESAKHEKDTVFTFEYQCVSIFAIIICDNCHVKSEFRPRQSWKPVNATKIKLAVRCNAPLPKSTVSFHNYVFEKKRKIQIGQTLQYARWSHNERPRKIVDQ